MNEIKIFDNPMFGEIRTAGTAEQPLFCLADVCKAVGLTNPRQVRARLDDSDVQLIDLHAVNPNDGHVYGNSVANFVTESGFYDVILQSSSPNVKPVRKWVTGEVLPAIRKTGGYIPVGPQMTEQEILAHALQITQRTIEEQKKRIVDLQVESARQLHKISEHEQTMRKMQPKVTFAEFVGKSDDTVSVDMMAKLLAQNGVPNMGEKRLFQWLRQHLYISDQKNTWNRPYQKWIERGIFRIETSVWKDVTTGTAHISYIPRVTTKGQEYFVKMFTKDQPQMFGAMTSVK